jgi:hypothetical protein
MKVRSKVRSILMFLKTWGTSYCHHCVTYTGLEGCRFRTVVIMITYVAMIMTIMIICSELCGNWRPEFKILSPENTVFLCKRASERTSRCECLLSYDILCPSSDGLNLFFSLNNLLDPSANDKKITNWIKKESVKEIQHLHHCICNGE